MVSAKTITKTIVAACAAIPAFTSMYFFLQREPSALTAEDVLARPLIYYGRSVQAQNLAQSISIHNSRVSLVNVAKQSMADGYLSEQELFGPQGLGTRTTAYDFKDSSVSKLGSGYHLATGFKDWGIYNEQDIYADTIASLIKEARRTILQKNEYIQHKEHELEQLLALSKNLSLTPQESDYINGIISRQSMMLVKDYGLSKDSPLGAELMRTLSAYSLFLEEQKNNGWVQTQAQHIAQIVNEQDNSFMERTLGPIFFSLVLVGGIGGIAGYAGRKKWQNPHEPVF